MPVPAAIADAVPSAAELARTLDEFFAAHPRAAVFEDGRLLFDLQSASYSVAADHGRCLLHLWSEERNAVRTVTSFDLRRGALRLETRRFGQTKAQHLTLTANPDFRAPTARDSSRRRFLRALEQALTVRFPEWTTESIHSAMDLEHSFGPAYARGILTRGQSAWAVLGAGPDESPAVIEGALTLGVLWLARCREQSDGRRVFQGLRLVLPEGHSSAARARMSWLHPAAAQWELFELNARTGELTQSPSDHDGNLQVELNHAFDPQAALERASVAIEALRALLPAGLANRTEIRPLGAAEIAFSLHGLVYARIRHSVTPGSFARRNQIVFGAGPNETVLDEDTEDLFRDLVDRLLQSRDAAAPGRDALYRLQPERWLESVLRRDLAALDPMLGGGPVYSQVPALASANRTLLDLLTVTRHGRLAVLELKADDDLHLPLQALDYWARVRQLHRDGLLQRHGYFPGLELSADDPLLLLVAPALHIHPANETVLRQLSPSIPWEMIALDEHWRDQCRVVLRKRAGSSQQAERRHPNRMRSALG